uniref:Aminotransferase class I/classII domain-containing protein n=1 Tax=Vombatus ursinus TaxID=29139 RepID=A0A4X2LYN2_VOMUR
HIMKYKESRKKHFRKTKNILVEFSNLSTYSTVVNFGQGQPHISPPIYVKEELAKVAATHKMNQYTWGFESI